MKNLERKIIEKYNLNPATASSFIRKLKEITVDKDQYLIKKGDFNDNLYFVKEGILRAYIPNDNDDQTIWFGYEGQVIFDVWCYQRGEKSPVSIEAIVPCKLYYIPKVELEQLCSESLPICNLMRMILIGHAMEAEESYARLFDCDGGMERYLSVLKHHPELLQNVPLKKLASYIQLAPQSLSRISAKVK